MASELVNPLGYATAQFGKNHLGDRNEFLPTPDAGMTPFRSEKDTYWNGESRVPLLVPWPGHIPAGVVSNEIVQHHDWLPTFLAAAGEPYIVEKCKKGHKAEDETFKLHIEGFNLLPYLTGKEKKNSRAGFACFDDEGNLVALR